MLGAAVSGSEDGTVTPSKRVLYPLVNGIETLCKSHWMVFKIPTAVSKDLPSTMTGGLHKTLFEDYWKYPGNVGRCRKTKQQQNPTKHTEKPPEKHCKL